jgi:Mlo family
MGEGGGGLSEEEIKLEYTPTWIVAGVCSVIVLISLVVERLLHRLGKVGIIPSSLQFFSSFFHFQNRDMFV